MNTQMTNTTTYSAEQINQAIDLDAAAWAVFFNVTSGDQIEERRSVMRANVAVGFVKSLLPFLAR